MYASYLVFPVPISAWLAAIYLVAAGQDNEVWRNSHDCTIGGDTVKILDLHSVPSTKERETRTLKNINHLTK